MIPSTTGRVTRNTDAEINLRIYQEMLERLGYYQEHPEDIDARLAELNDEWDVERTLEANASTLALSGILLSFVYGRKPLYLSAAVATFLLQHAIQGWCPPLPILRRLGFRTASEIETERNVLNLLRGDFDQLSRYNDLDAALRLLQSPAERQSLH